MKKKETIRSLWTPTAGMLSGARRAAMLLLTTLLLTMTAQTAWAQDVISINYELYGGTNSPDNPETYNSEAGVSSLSNPIPPENSGYIFGGWYTDPDFSTPVSEPAIPDGSTDDFYFYAKWLKSITVTADWNDGDNLDGKRPGDIDVNLLANGTTVEPRTLWGENNHWTSTFENIPVHAGEEEIEYTISIVENPIEDLYEYSIAGTDITFTRKTGGLTVINTVTNSLEYLNDKEFTFTVTLEPKISGTFGDMNFNNGIATFTLKNGEPFTASGLPTSLGYTVTVDPEEGFTSEESTITGTVATDGSSTAAFAHTYSAVGSVTLEAKANVENPYLQTKSFAFNLLNADRDVIQNVEQINETGKATFDPINYTLDDLAGNKSKDFVYTIEQVIPDEAETINGWPAYNGVAYEKESKSVTVTVTDKGDGTLGVSDFTIPEWDNKVVVTVTADDLSKVYGENDPELTAKVKVGDIIINGGIDYSLSRQEGDDVGNYDITPVGELNQGYYTIIYNSGTLTINRKVVTITAGSDSRTYDGTALNKNTFTATPLESGDTHTFTVEMTSESTITDVGTQPNVIAKVDGVAVETGEETIVGNYLVTTVNGTLTINPITENVTVTITEHSNSDEIVYDGQEHTVTGYDVTSISNTLYTEDDFTFSGNAEVKGTDAGTYPMELKPEDFTNTNQNFSNVTFNVIDGALTITPVTVKVSVVDKGNGQPIVGLAVVVMIKSNTETNGKIIHNWYSTTENHEISVLKAGGEYTIIGNAYLGYTRSAEYTLTIDENGNVSFYSGTITQDGVLLVESGQTHVEFSVVDKANRTALAGATIQVIDSDNKVVVEEWTSGTENHIIKGLFINREYTLCETVAPDGYAAPDACTFTIDETGKVTTTDGTTTTDEEGNTVLVLENPFTVPLFAANSSNLWMTWCDKYDYVKPEGVTVYTVSGVENNTVTLGEVSDVIPAYTPVLLYREAAGDDVVTATFSAVGTEPEIGYDSSSGIVEANLSNNVTLYGNSGDEAYASGSSNNIFAISDFSDTQSYVLRNGNFVAVDKDGGIGAHRCWLNVTKSTTNGARMLGINTGGENTGIETTNFTNPANSSGAWYGIDGRKLDGKPTKKGLYIYNGKKHVIK